MISIREELGPGLREILNVPDEPRAYFRWSHGQEIEDVPVEARRVHMSVVPSADRLKALLVHCPGLRELRLTPTYFSLSQGALEMLREAGVEVTAGRLQEANVYDNRSVGDEARRVREWLLPRLEELADKIAVLDAKLPQQMGWFRRRYLSTDDRASSLSKQAAAAGVSRNAVRRWLQGILFYLGYPVRYPEQQANVERALRPARSQEERRPYWMYARDMPVRERLLQMPEKVRELPEKQRWAVTGYYGLEEGGQRRTLRELGEERGICREYVRQLVNRGVRRLGLARRM